MTSRNKSVKNVGTKRNASKGVDDGKDKAVVVLDPAEKDRVKKFTKIYEKATNDICHMTKEQLEMVKEGKPEMKDYHSTAE